MSQILSSQSGPSPLHAIAYDMRWAEREARLCRSRLLNRGFTRIPIEDEEISSLLGLLWTRVCAGTLGSFSPKPNKPVDEQVKAYVAACLDNEVIRYLHQEGSPGLVATPKRHRGAVLSVSLSDTAEDDEEPGIGELASQSPYAVDPLEQMLAKEESTTLPGWPGPLGELLSDHYSRAMAFPKRDAHIIRARLPVENVPEDDRVNLAWVLVQAAYEGNAAITRAIAPLLTSVWVDETPGSLREQCKRLYPRLHKQTPAAEVARQESRDLLRYLATHIAPDCAVSPEHVNLVVRDAQAALTRWVGRRGPYKKKSQAQDASDAQDDDAQNESFLDEEDSPGESLGYGAQASARWAMSLVA